MDIASVSEFLQVNLPEYQDMYKLFEETGVIETVKEKYYYTMMVVNNGKEVDARTDKQLHILMPIFAK